MDCDQGTAGAEFNRMLNEEADPLESMEPLEIISRAQATLEHYAGDVLARYAGSFEHGKVLPPEATMETRGLITIMQITAQNLNVAIGRLTEPA